MKKRRLLFVFVCILFSTISFGQAAALVDSLIEMGNSKVENSRNSEAIDLFIRARKISEIEGLNRSYFSASINLANLFILTSRTEEALKIFDEIQPSQDTDPALNCQYYHRKAFYFNQVNSLDSAIIYSEKALDIADKNHLKSAKGTVLNELSNVYLRKGEYDKALEYANLSCELYKDQPRYYANAYFNKAIVYHLMGNYTRSVKLLKDNLDNIKDTEWHSVKGPIYYYLADAHFKQGDSLSGYRYLSQERQETLKKQEQEHIKSFNNLLVEYETEQKNLELAENRNLINHQEYQQRRSYFYIISLVVLLLGVFIVTLVLRRKNRRLSELVQQNNFLIGETNHRIKNNLQLINSLIADEMDKEGAKNDEHLQQIASKIETITTLHQQLYLNEDRSKINLTNYLNSLFQNLNNLIEPNQIELELDFHEVEFYGDRSVYFGLLINELLTNSVKHAFPKDQKEKRIKVSLKEVKNDLVLNYLDNGKGIDNGIEPHLVNLMCKQLKAKYRFKSEVGFYFEMEVNR